MNKCRWRRLSGGVALLLGVLSAQGAIAENEMAHERDYREALDKAIQGESRIAHEMARVQYGQVAHYDFLQYEHIELIRHARALAHPPVGTPYQTSIATHARELLSASNALEWVIADFLRALALVRSASSNTLDIAIILKQTADPSQVTALNNLIEQIERFRDSGYQTGWEALDAAFAEVANGSPANRGRGELAFQRRLLHDNAPSPTELRYALLSSPVDEQARQLAALYTP